MAPFLFFGNNPFGFPYKSETHCWVCSSSTPKSSGGWRNVNRQVKVKGVRVMHEISNIFTKEKTISSLEVAEMVGKQHKNLLADVRGYVEELGQLKIQPSDFFKENTYQNSQNKTMPCYDITKKGCEFIAHKLTGIKGTKFTALYINRFHEMEEQLKPKVPQTYFEALKELVVIFGLNYKRVAA